VNQMPYTPAEFESKSFNCVHSDYRAFAAQQWGDGSAKFREVGYIAIANLRICRCIHCGTDSFWWKGRLVWPDISTAPLQIQIFLKRF